MKKKIIFTLSVVLIGLTGNAQWQQTTLDTGMVVSIAAKGTTIFAGESNFPLPLGKIFLSMNGGITWTDVFDAPASIESIVINDSNIYAGTWGGNESGLYLSGNNGSTWSLMSAAPNNIESLAANGTNIFAGTDHSLYYSSDNGATWNTSSIPMYEVMSLNLNGINIFTGTHGAGVFFSNDNGASWTSKGLTNKDINSLASTTTSVFAGAIDTIFKSDDSGTTWVPSFYSGFSYCRALATMGQNIFAGAEEGGVFLSTDNGVNWTSINQGLIDLSVRSLAISDSIVYLGTSNHGVWRRSLNEVLSGINNNVSNPVQVIIYPNPVRNISDVVLNSAFKVANAELKIYNLFGEVCRSYSGIKSNCLTIEKGNLHTGIYFYKLSQSNKVISEGKLIVD